MWKQYRQRKEGSSGEMHRSTEKRSFRERTRLVGRGENQNHFKRKTMHFRRVIPNRGGLNRSTASKKNLAGLLNRKRTFPGMKEKGAERLGHKP